MGHHLRFLMSMSIPLLILMLSIRQSHSQPKQTPEELAAAANLGVFQRMWAQAEKQEKKDDCDFDQTKESLKFLRLTNEDLKEDGLGKDKTGFYVDCSLRKTNLTLLRQYLVEKGFSRQPGSLVLVDDQDTQLKLICNNQTGNKREEYAWRVEGLGVDEVDDADFNKDKKSGNVLNMGSPVGYRYFRKFTCFSKGTDPPRCSHVFYVLTRPQPKVTFPLQVLQGGNINFTCEMNPCSSTGCDIAGKPNNPKPQPPYTFEWVVPPTVWKKLKKKAKVDEFEKYKCAYLVGDELLENPMYVKVNNNMTTTPDLQDLSEKKIMISLHNSAKNLSDDEGKHHPTPIGSSIVIDKATEDYAGSYECVIIDGNGVPSTPNRESLHKSNRYTGRVFLHVRRTMFMIIPAGIIGVVLLLMVMVHWCCPPKMEYDDGTPYTKEELVSPDQDKRPNQQKEQGDQPQEVKDGVSVKSAKSVGQN